MRRHPAARSRRAELAAAAGIVGIAYAWIATGVAPFTATAYLLVGVPSFAALTLYARLGAFSPRQQNLDRLYLESAGHPTIGRVAPWLAVLAGTVVLEAVGLALGGRSKYVPTLSTAMDHLLVAHWGRGALYALWLVAGAWPLRRLARVRHARSD